MNQSQVKLAGVLLVVVAVTLSVGGVHALKGLTTSRAAVTVRIERDETDLPELGPRAAAGTDLTFLMQTEAELVRSETVLSKVVQALDLNQEWGRRNSGGQPLKSAESIQLLRARVHAEPLPNSTLLRIQVTSGSTNDAVKLADTVAKTYCQYRNSRRSTLAQTAIAELSGQYKVLEQAARLAQEKLAVARNNLRPAERENRAVTNAGSADALRQLRRQQAEATLRYMTASNQLASLRSNNAPTNAIGQVEVRVERSKADLAQAAAALRAELERVETIAAYQSAEQEWQEADRLFNHARNTMADLQTKLKVPEQPPAMITEPAALQNLAPDQTTTGKMFLLGGGLALAIGLVLILFPSLMAAKPLP